MAKLRVAHASKHGARKPPGPKLSNLDNFPFNRLKTQQSENKTSLDASVKGLVITGPKTLTWD